MDNIFERNGLFQQLGSITGMNSRSHSDSFGKFGAIGSLVKSLFSMFI